MSGIKRRVIKKTVKPGKDLVDSMADDFRTKLIKLVTQGINDLTIDFKGVEMVDSVGLGVLIAAYNSLDCKGGTLRMKNVSGDIHTLIKTLRLDQHFEVTAAES